MKSECYESEISPKDEFKNEYVETEMSVKAEVRVNIMKYQTKQQSCPVISRLEESENVLMVKTTQSML